MRLTIRPSMLSVVGPATIGLLLCFAWATPRAHAGTIPFQEAATYDGPQPHGPGTPLIDHPPHRFGGLTSDSMGFEVPGATIVYQYVADDFALSSDASIRRIVYFGFYNSQVLPIGDETFQINFHEPRPADGLPGDVIYSETVVNPFREWTGHHVISAAGGREYRFTVDLSTPFFVQGGETTWLSIYQVGDSASSFRWEDSVAPPPPNGAAAKNEVFPNWTPYAAANNAFQLYSIPEPSSLALILVSSLMLVRIRSRRTVR